MKLKKKEYTDWKTEKDLSTLTEANAILLWGEKGFIRDNDIKRINGDWYDAKRFVAFMLADKIVELCKKRMTFIIPPYYYPYLHNIGLEEYKKIKAYFIWKRNGGQIPDDELKNYYPVCNELSNIFFNNKLKNIPLISFEEYIKESLLVIDSIKKRKAFWQYLSREGETQTHWHEADNFVETFYHGLFDIIKIRSDKKFVGLKDFVFEKTHLLNMMEFCISSLCFV